MRKRENISNEDLASDIDEVKSMVVAVHSAVVGNPKMGHKGLATRVEESEAMHKATEKKLEEHDRKLWLASIVLSLGGTIALFAKDWLPMFKK